MRFVIGPGEGALPAVRTVRPPHRTTVVRVTETGVVTHQLGDLVSTHACAACGIPFAARAKNQVTCGRKKCRAVMSYSKRRDDVEDRKRRRARFTRWYNENRERVIANVMARKKAA
jgi:hypothetical protein